MLKVILRDEYGQKFMISVLQLNLKNSLPKLPLFLFQSRSTGAQFVIGTDGSKTYAVINYAMTYGYSDIDDCGKHVSISQIIFVIILTYLDISSLD